MFVEFAHAPVKVNTHETTVLLQLGGFSCLPLNVPLPPAVGIKMGKKSYRELSKTDRRMRRHSGLSVRVVNNW